MEHFGHVCVLRRRRLSSIVIHLYPYSFTNKSHSLCIRHFIHTGQGTESADHASIIVFSFNAIIAFKDSDFHSPSIRSFVIPLILCRFAVIFLAACHCCLPLCVRCPPCVILLNAKIMPMESIDSIKSVFLRRFSDPNQKWMES